MLNLKDIPQFKSFVESDSKLISLELYLSPDNREVTIEHIFIAIVGERYNPLQYLDKLIQTGWKFVVYEKNEDNDQLIEEYGDSLIFISVSNIFDFIQEAGKHVAKTFKARGGTLLAISGSNGKTTTKEMLYHLLVNSEGKETVICTQKNNNNHIGVPFTLFQIKEETKFAIIELGSNHPGEIKVLCELLNPQYGVTTNIGDSHLEFFGTRENVLKEEGLLYSYTENGFFINQDDELLKKFNLREADITYGGHESDFKFSFEGQKLLVNEVEFENKNITGKHNFINLGVAISIAHKLTKRPLVEFKDMSSTFEPTKNRSEWVEYKGLKVFLDAYNANPSSMQSAVDGFSDYLGSIGANNQEACLVLGDMNRLGPDSEKYHEELGAFLKSYSFAECFFVGKYAKSYKGGYDKKSTLCASAKDVTPLLNKMAHNVKYLFIKGSRSLQLEQILDIR